MPLPEYEVLITLRQDLQIQSNSGSNMEKSQAIQMQMKKFGWREGQGLGKNEQGMKEAIKVSIKNNKNGLGLDPSEQFVFHWWDHVFNKVANSIKIKDVDGEVRIIFAFIT